MRILSDIKKELLEITHDQTMLLVLLVFPIFIMLFMGSSFRSIEINGLPIGLTGATNTSAETLFNNLDQSVAFKLMNFESEEEAMRAFRNGQLRAVIIVPEGFDYALQNGYGSTIKIVVDNSDLALEQSILAAMSSVIEASSANITKNYISAAWMELKDLNNSASLLATDIAATRSKMQETKDTLVDIRDKIDDIDIDSLKQSLNKASTDSAQLQTMISEQQGELDNITNANEHLLNETDLFIQNASFALDESIITIGSTHEKLNSQIGDLENTIDAIDATILGLETIKIGADAITIIALDLNIGTLESLRTTTSNQITDTRTELMDLESLNTTLNSFGDALDTYSNELATARTDSGKIIIMREVLDNITVKLADINDSFSDALVEIEDLESLLNEVDDTTSQIDITLDSALNQTSSVNTLITSLQQTVATQTGKNPNIIASPLSIEVQNQYTRTSFVDFMMPQIISLSLLLSCLLIGALSLVREKIGKTIVRALLAPGALATLVIGKILTMVLLSIGQTVLILVVALAIFGVGAPENILMLLLGITISALVLSSIGILIGFYAKSESAAIQTSLLIAIPMIFLGNIIFSADLLPNYTQILQQLLPLAHVTNIFKIVLITNGDPTVDMGALLFYFVLLAMVLGYIMVKRKDIIYYS
ncbi:MAG: ABC transporter permease [Candidatus Micrarchaeota archaeon]